MSTATSRQKASTTKRQSRKSHKKQGSRSGPKQDVMVLIRLPDLNEAPVPAEVVEDATATSTDPTQSSSAQGDAVPEQATEATANVAPAPPSPVTNASDEPVQPASSTMSRMSGKLVDLRRSLGKLNIVRYASPLAGVALIAVLCIAVAMLIFGGDDPQPSTLPVDTPYTVTEPMPAVVYTPHPLVASRTDGLPALPALPAEPAQPAPPVVNQTPVQPEETTPPPAAAPEPLVEEEPADIEPTPPAEEPSATAEPKQTDSQEAEAEKAEAEEAAAEPAAAEPAAEETTPPEESPKSAPKSQPKTTIEPLREEIAAEDNTYKYPVTDPSTWNPDYSPRYQELLLNPTSMDQNAAGRRNSSTWESTTARLHPEIVAPPIQ